MQRGGRVRRCRPLGQLGPRWRAKWAPYSKPSATHSPSPIIPSANRHDQSLAEPRSEGAPWPQVHPAHAHDCEDPVGFQNSATGLDLGFYATRSYSLRRPPRMGRRLIRSRERSATV